MSLHAPRILCLALAIALAACGGDDPASPDTTADTHEADTSVPEDTASPEDTTLDDTALDDTGAADTGPGDATPEDTGPVEDTVEVEDTAPDDGHVEDTAPPEDTTPPEDTALPAGRTPVPGDLVLTEVLIDPASVPDVFGEWFEVESLATDTLELAGCVIGNGASQTATVGADAGATLVDPGELRVLGLHDDPSVNGGVPVDVRYSGMLLSNTAGALVLSCDGVEIDRVDYDAALWVVLPGVAIGLSQDAPRTAAANDDPGLWCEALTPYGDGDRGTPAATNRVCPVRDTEVDACALIAPLDDAIYEGEAALVVGELFEAGFTDLSPEVDFIYFLAAQAGYGPVGSDPADDEGWTWVDATPTPDWDDTAGAAGFDRYEVNLDAPSIGAWDVTFRFSLDAGQTWTACDTTPDDGVYTPAEAGRLEVLDSPCVPNPCAGPPSVCDGDVEVSFAALGACALDGDGDAECTFAETRLDCAALAGRCEDGACVDTARLPAAGELVITEILKAPRAVSDSLGEWVELTNVTDDALDLAGCALRDNGPDRFDVPTSPPIIIFPGATFVFGKSTDSAVNGGAPVDLAVGPAMNLNNGSDVVVVECAGVIVDVVAYTSAYPSALGVSMNLDPRKTVAADNDVPSAWCAGALPYPDADGLNLGTPNQPNHPCPDPVGRCRLVAPAAAELLDGAPFQMTGQVRKVGFTDLTAGTDPSPLMRGQAGWGPRNTSPTAPATAEAWTWTEASADLGWTDPSEDGADDQYVATVTAPPDAGDYDLAFRFSADSGITWTVCDLATATPGEDGSQNGYQSDNAGRLTVTVASACNPNPCLNSSPGTCSDATTLVRLAPVGTCTLVGDDLDQADCAYAEEVVDCGALGGACLDGACVDVAPRPSAGEIIITELMIQPAAVADFFGEWVEVHNVTGATLNLDGCVFRDAGIDHHVVNGADGGLLIGAGARLVFGKSTAIASNGGVAVDHAWGQAVALGNQADELVLACGDDVVDRVDWGAGSGAGVPILGAPGVAAQLSSVTLDAGENDLGQNWCHATAPYGAGDVGTPGDNNAPCPRPIARCRLHEPPSAEVGESFPFSATARLSVPGVTDRSPVTDVALGVTVELGYGPRGTDPATDIGWTFLEADPDADWLDVAEPGFDAWTATAIAPAVGAWDYAFRVSADGGATLTYCDLDSGAPGEDGSEDGYQIDRAGHLEVTASACTGASCDVAPDPDCDGDLRQLYEAAGACLSGACVHPLASTEDCADVGEGWVCDDGACVDGAIP